MNASRRAGWRVCLTFAALLCGAAAGWSDELPLFEEEPFDQVTLTEQAGGASLKIFPLSDEGRRQISEHQPTTRLRIRLVDHPEMEFDVEWKNIARVDLFPDILLQETNRLIKARQLDRAFQYLQYLKREHPGLPGFDAALQTFLFTDAGNSYRNGQLREALAVLDELYHQNPNRPGLDAALKNVVRRLFEQYVSRANYRAARIMLGWAPEQFGPENLAATVAAWRRQLIGIAEKDLATARRHVAQRDWQMAHEAARRALAVWPELDGAAELAAEIDQRYPHVVVGVTRRGTGRAAQRVDDWSAWRDGRVLRRLLIERRGFGADGVRYYCPWGGLTVAADRRHVSLQLRPPDDESATPLDGVSVSRLLLARAEPTSLQFDPLWARHMRSVAVDDVYAVDVEFSAPLLRPEALLAVPLQGDASAERGDLAAAPPSCPYVVGRRDERETRLLRNDAYLLRTATQPAEIVERYFADPAKMATALENGEIDACDRIYPADVARLRSRAQIIVAPYAVPTVHFLMPNLNRPFPGQRSFRRALVYGLNRPVILRELLGAAEIEGCQVISGPFPPGSSREDPLAYAYNFQVTPRSYDPRMAVTLSEVSQLEVAGLAAKAGRPAAELEPLILLHPADALPRIASSMIAEQLTALGIKCETKELGPEDPMPAADAWDLMYLDVVMSEPLYDVQQLIGRNGLARGGSAYLEYALSQLGSVANWSDARQQLGDIHRLAYEELVVIPLWQVIEFYAYRENLTGVGQRLLSLYDNIERWKVGLQPRVAGR